jgi:hypothetical protein
MKSSLLRAHQVLLRTWLCFDRTAAPSGRRRLKKTQGYARELTNHAILVCSGKCATSVVPQQFCHVVAGVWGASLRLHRSAAKVKPYSSITSLGPTKSCCRRWGSGWSIEREGGTAASDRKGSASALPYLHPRLISLTPPHSSFARARLCGTASWAPPQQRPRSWQLWCLWRCLSSSSTRLVMCTATCTCLRSHGPAVRMHGCS